MRKIEMLNTILDMEFCNQIIIKTSAVILIKVNNTGVVKSLLAFTYVERHSEFGALHPGAHASFYDL